MDLFVHFCNQAKGVSVKTTTKKKSCYWIQAWQVCRHLWQLWQFYIHVLQCEGCSNILTNSFWRDISEVFFFGRRSYLFHFKTRNMYQFIMTQSNKICDLSWYVCCAILSRWYKPVIYINFIKIWQPVGKFKYMWFNSSTHAILDKKLVYQFDSSLWPSSTFYASTSLRASMTTTIW